MHRPSKLRPAIVLRWSSFPQKSDEPRANPHTGKHVRHGDRRAVRPGLRATFGALRPEPQIHSLPVTHGPIRTVPFRLISDKSKSSAFQTAHAPRGSIMQQTCSNPRCGFNTRTMPGFLDTTSPVYRSGAWRVLDFQAFAAGPPCLSPKGEFGVPRMPENQASTSATYEVAQSRYALG